MSTSCMPGESFDPGAIVQGSFRLLAQAPVVIGVAAVLPMAVLTFVNFALFGTASLTGGDAFGGFQANAASIAGVGAITILATALAVGFLYGAVSRAALDEATGDGARLDTALRAGLVHWAPIAILSFVTGVGAAVAAIALIVPGLYLLGMWWLVAPAVVAERTGLSALGRSAELTRGYRWPMVGMILIYLIVYIAVTTAGTWLQSVFAMLGVAGLLVSGTIGTLTGAFLSALSTVTSVLAYNRLCEIKEGTGERVADIFS